METWTMVVVGIDAHKLSHTAVVVDDAGRELGVKTVNATLEGHLCLLEWVGRFDGPRRWAVEDCRHLSRNFERDLLAVGEVIARVPPKLMAHARDAARTYGKSDPIDALAVARAALRYPDLPMARLDGPSRDLRLLVDHREDLVKQRTGMINRLRWHLHDLDPTLAVASRSLDRYVTLDRVESFLDGRVGVVARVARELAADCRAVTARINALAREIEQLVTALAPSLVALVGCGPLSAAKLVAETADVTRFSSRNAYASHNGTAPLPVWSGNRYRHRLSRVGNRQLNAAIHRIAITQMRIHDDARTLMERQ
ncbi:MAG: IS110 family transposase, partial [Actinomycetota bacterium]